MVMKLNGSVLVAVVTMVGSMALATGCNKTSDAGTQPDSSPAPTAQPQAPVAIAPSTPAAPAAKNESASVSGSVKVGFGTQAPAPRYVYALAAPPAPRFEYVGRPPSARHIWVKGYWKYT